MLIALAQPGLPPLRAAHALGGLVVAGARRQVESLAGQHIADGGELDCGH